MNLFKKAVPAASTPTAPGNRAPQVTEQQRLAVVALLHRLDGLDLGHLLADSRAALDRAEALRREFGQAHVDLRERFAHVRDEVIAGHLTPADAVDQLAALTPATAKIEHTAGTLAARLETETVAAVEAEAVHFARRDAGTVHRTLADKAAEIATAAPDAAATLFDLDGYVNGVQRAIQRPQWDAEHGCLHGWPRFDLSTVEPLRFGVVGTLRDLTSRLRELHDTARVLATLAPGTASVLYRTPPTRTEENYLTRWTPPELHLAVAARLGWTPGLWKASDAKPRPGERVRQAPHNNDLRPDFGEEIIRTTTRGAVATVNEQQHENRLLTGR